jgi:integrase/recombinase XerC
VYVSNRTTARADRAIPSGIGRLTPEQLIQLAPLIRGAMKDKSYQLTPIGKKVAAYLRAKRKRLTDESYRDYESGLDKLARYFPDLRVEDFEPPTGTERLEEFLDYQWGGSAPKTYNKGLSIIRDFFRWQIIPRGPLHGDPTFLIERAKDRQIHRTTFPRDQRLAILAAAVELRDRIALRFLLDYALRKGALRGIQINHFDYERHRLIIFTKGQKVREIPIPDAAFWTDLERYILESEAQPHHYLMAQSTGRYGKIDPTKPMGPHGEHNWRYKRLAAAGIVAKGTTKGQRMHKARHTAGQRVLDKTGNLKAVQQLLGHASIQTTGDIYTDWDIDQLAATMAEVLDDDRPTDNEPNPKLIPLNLRKSLQNRTIYRQRDSNPCYRSERAAS